MRKSKEEKQIDVSFAAAFRLHGNCVQINIMDLGKVRDESVAAYKAGQTMDDAVKAAIAKYRKN